MRFLFISSLNQKRYCYQIFWMISIYLSCLRGFQATSCFFFSFHSSSLNSINFFYKSKLLRKKKVFEKNLKSFPKSLRVGYKDPFLIFLSCKIWQVIKIYFKEILKLLQFLLFIQAALLKWGKYCYWINLKAILFCILYTCPFFILEVFKVSSSIALVYVAIIQNKQLRFWVPLEFMILDIFTLSFSYIVCTVSSK